MDEDKWDAAREAKHDFSGSTLTPEEKVALLARLKAECDLAADEAEFRELLVQFDQGLLISGDEVFQWLEKVLTEPQVRGHKEAG
jgi:hypothetical protein